MIEYRGAREMDRVAGLVNELVQLKVDVLIAPIPGAIRAAKQATKTTPIVMSPALIQSQPGWSIAWRVRWKSHGITTLAADLSGKRLELLKEVVPQLSRVGILVDFEVSASAITLKEYEAMASALKIQIQTLEVRGLKPDLEGAFQSAARLTLAQLSRLPMPTFFFLQRLIADLAIKNRMPSMFQGSTWVESGGLMSYSTDDLPLCAAPPITSIRS